MVKSTIRQQAAFKKMLEKLANHEPVILGAIMREVGYASATAINPGLNLTSKEGWEVLKMELDSGGAKQALNELVSSENTNKNVRLAAAVEIIKIQGGYPQQENQVIGLFEKVGELQKDDKPEAFANEDKLSSAPGTAGSPEVQE